VFIPTVDSEEVGDDIWAPKLLISCRSLSLKNSLSVCFHVSSFCLQRGNCTLAFCFFEESIFKVSFRNSDKWSFL